MKFHRNSVNTLLILLASFPTLYIYYYYITIIIIIHHYLLFFEEDISFRFFKLHNRIKNPC